VTGDRQVIGFVGLGAMGSRMAVRLAEAGHEVIVHNRTAAKSQALRQPGIRIAGTPAEVAAKADIVCGCLLDGAAIEQVYLGPDGLIDGCRSGQIFVEHGTFAPALARDLAGRFGAHGAAFPRSPAVQKEQRPEPSRS
jgi:3-hydroxyisobutyrate dehydrogenase-like beta-hydroxyacid dehydrogenase